MLAGLRRKALRIGTDEYVFSARNETTKDVLTWKPSNGVRKFVINDAAGIGQFRVQFQSSDAARAINWGATFERQAGNCYWVNAILRIERSHVTNPCATSVAVILIKIERSALSESKFPRRY